ncbi:siderophore-interacting protein [Nocardioides sp. ChNu-99]|uniref:siderophore-interacting protein n=1 Tax=Nocardioides sp. ChNu-99 TaxID=2839897 RepID=UPI002406CA25|nr:siderophore-interacting protein [Nocardioides sp. ChNu-99]MDF9716122.1 siderophore-interacting protein [Nocardioides sp. ChNu-99]
MARTNAQATRTKPADTELILLEVLRSERVTPHMTRVTLGGRDAARFVPRGFDQWFRLFIPVGEASVRRMPSKLTTVSYLRLLAVSRTERPVLRNYTVRAHRADGPHGPELDVDLVVHGSVEDGTSGPAATWAQTCAVGDVVGIIDEGCLYAAPDDTDQVLLVADESGLPAVAGVLASLPRDARGSALVEVPSAEDAQEVDAPDGVEVRYVVRTDPHAVPGRAVLAAAREVAVTGAAPYAWVAGEQGLVSQLRRHWVQVGVDKSRICFTGYWKVGKTH